MKRARWVIIVLAVVFVAILSAVCWRAYGRHGSDQRDADTEDAYYAAEETLLKYLGILKLLVSVRNREMVNAFAIKGI